MSLWCKGVYNEQELKNVVVNGLELLFASQNADENPVRARTH